MTKSQLVHSRITDALPWITVAGFALTILSIVVNSYTQYQLFGYRIQQLEHNVREAKADTERDIGAVNGRVDKVEDKLQAHLEQRPK